MKSCSQDHIICLSSRASKDPLRVIILLSLVVLVGSGCARSIELKPAPGANQIDEQGAAVQAAGVFVVVRLNAWSGQPSNLEAQLTPIHVTIENYSGRLLHIRYSDFELVSTPNLRYAVLPPYKVEGSAITSSLVGSDLSHTNFRAAPYHRASLPDLAPLNDPFAFDPFYLGRFYGVWQTPLPTEDMLKKAIPEGTLETSGHLSGFLYFPKIGKGISQVSFNAQLVDAKTGEAFGTVSIPFIVEQN